MKKLLEKVRMLRANYIINKEIRKYEKIAESYAVKALKGEGYVAENLKEYIDNMHYVCTLKKLKRDLGTA